MGDHSLWDRSSTRADLWRVDASCPGLNRTVGEMVAEGERALVVFGDGDYALRVLQGATPTTTTHPRTHLWHLRDAAQLVRKLGRHEDDDGLRSRAGRGVRRRVECPWSLQ